MTCNTCFTDWICKCVPYNDFIEVRSLLTPATEYYYKITDKFDAVYSGSVTSTADGYLEIPIANFPDGYFNEFAGTFNLQVFTDADFCNQVDIPLVGTYPCVTIEIKGGTTEKNTIGCAP